MVGRQWYRGAVVALLAVVGLTAPSLAEGLQKGDVVAVCGDSITEQKLYSLYIEDYLLMCQPQLNLRVHQFGWSGERAPGFLSRMGNEVLPFKPTVATTCYGMNDGGYGPINDGIADTYRKAQTAIVQEFKKAGLHLIVVGSPGVVDSDTYKRPTSSAEVYNQTLAKLGEIDKEIAAKEGVVFADLHTLMMDVMAKAKAKYGPKYHVAGGDGVHPAPNGHLVMAYAFLKAMGVDGNIGTITVDLAGNKATATEGHKVLGTNAGEVQLESTRYPFCFFGKPEEPTSTSGILEFLPFNQDLNRFMLVVTNPGAEKVKVTFGKSSKEFTAGELAKGINLAAEFLDNPFVEPFRKAEAVMQAQQFNETPLVKTMLHSVPDFKKMMPEESEALERMASKAIAKDKVMADASAKAVVPVKYTLKLEAVK